MNKSLFFLLLHLLYLLLAGCTPIKAPITNYYKLDQFSKRQFAHHNAHHSILVTLPTATAGYQTEQMRYTAKHFSLNTFAHSAWVDPPADMLLPLMVQSLQQSGLFYAVASSPNSEQADYRLDTQLIELRQNFIKKPSEIELVVKIVLSHTDDNRVIASRIIRQHIKCPIETPYGGVIAANRAVEIFTTELTDFIRIAIHYNHS